MENKPNTLQEAVQIIESLNTKINEFSAKCDSLEAENLSLRKKLEDSLSEVFGLKSSLESEQKVVANQKQKLEAAESESATMKTKLSELQEKYDLLSKKDMDVEARASDMAAKIVGESGIEKPVESSPESDDPSMEEIAEMLSEANGREKAALMDKYGDKISAYLKK